MTWGLAGSAGEKQPPEVDDEIPWRMNSTGSHVSALEFSSVTE